MCQKPFIRGDSVRRLFYVFSAALTAAIVLSSCGSPGNKAEEPVRAAVAVTASEEPAIAEQTEAAGEPVIRQEDKTALKSFKGWEKTPKGWRYYDRNGEILTDEWLEDEEHQWYYFDSDGYMLHDTVTPDGFWVGSDGKLEDKEPEDKEPEGREPDNNKPEKQAETALDRPFYGIWCDATKDYDEAYRFSEKTAGWGFAAEVFLTADWDNLNPERWYAVTAGVYYSNEEAEAVLPAVKQYYPDAYVKYSGHRR